jgi:hypothetical protein
MTNKETAEVSQMSKGALNFPTFGVTAQSAAIVAGASAASPAMGTDQDDPAL